MRLADTTQRVALRNRLVVRHLQLAEKVAARYRRDPRAQDIRQVAALTLVEAAERFDPGRGVPFSAYATPTLAGALKRYIRDNRWSLHTSRRHGELLARMTDVRDRLTQHLGRDPTVAETATAMRCRESDVTSTLRVLHEQHMLSLDGPADLSDDGSTIADTLADNTDETGAIDDREALHAQLRRLPQRELQVVILRFYGNRTYEEIGEQVGCSPAQVIRLLRTALDRLRAALDGAAPQPTEHRRTATDGRPARSPATRPRQWHEGHRRTPAPAPHPPPARPAGMPWRAAPPGRNGCPAAPARARARRHRARPSARGPPLGPDAVIPTVREHRRGGSTRRDRCRGRCRGRCRTSVAPTRSGRRHDVHHAHR
ncbi:sigma-70 family RNA polymerase sigma factor [Dactylosporangium fulvum]|uniref:Sigma-70 family RNA polymerase sigma factor n=1 Tax=Dactylosporangium fulvum TaxID=53359 RepID=A0ABY5W775_9ACTN|nr:sigma-70 family RNA polymerase sigma factor [Dactylosporangium fulvum]UWP85176.1 sigma-70 family RNA polymerase sigma factor [Dactylosporangium fulvum]